MKTNKLIKYLKELDPKGDMEVCVENTDIYFIDIEPGCYDGPQQILIHDPKLENECYSIKGGIFNYNDNKVIIHTFSIEDAFIHAKTHNKKFPITILGDKEGEVGYEWQQKEIQKRIESWKQTVDKIKKTLKKLKRVK